MDVKMPDGTIVQNVPDDITQEDLLESYAQFNNAAPVEEETTDGALLQTVKNIPSSAGNLVSSIVQPILHPIDTVKGLRSAYRGAIQNVLPEGWVNPYEESKQDIATADAVGGFYKDRFGSMENVRNTVIKDPVGFASDAAAALSVAGLGLRAAGLSKVSDAALKASQVIDPVYQTTKAVKKAATPVYKGLLGQTTGVGSRVIGEALKGSDEFTDALRGKTSEVQIVDKAKDALDDIRIARGDAYRSKLENLKTSTKELNIDDVKILADDQLKRYGVTKTQKGLDFNRSSVSGSSEKEIKEVYEMVQDWGSRPGDLTPSSLDILKRRLDDYYAEGRTSRAMVTTLKKAVQQKLVKAVPEYAEMTKDYAKSTEIIKEMERAVGLGDKTSADTALRKLTMALREDKNFRADLLKTLESSTGENITGAVAGSTMKPLATRGLGSVVTGSIGLSGLAMSSPTLAALIPLASPRLVGELSVLLGKSGKLAPTARKSALVSNQVGRLPLQQ